MPIKPNIPPNGPQQNKVNTIDKIPKVKALLEPGNDS